VLALQGDLPKHFAKAGADSGYALGHAGIKSTTNLMIGYQAEASHFCRLTGMVYEALI
jgi:hypothetical protein